MVLFKITSDLCSKNHSVQNGHSGIDFKMEIIPTSFNSRWNCRLLLILERQYRKWCLVRWNDGKVAIYGHMSETTVNVGDKVQTGDLLGYSGNSGHVVGANGGYHLHFGLKENGHFIDPSPYIDNIQNMNTTLVQHIPDVVPTKLNFFDYMQSHMNVLSDLKMHLIHLPYDTLLIQISKQFLQFISVQSSFLNHIIACIF
jgi:hypothetical protein